MTAPAAPAAATVEPRDGDTATVASALPGVARHLPRLRLALARLNPADKASVAALADAARSLADQVDQALTQPLPTSAPTASAPDWSGRDLTVHTTYVDTTTGAPVTGTTVTTATAGPAAHPPTTGALDDSDVDDPTDRGVNRPPAAPGYAQAFDLTHPAAQALVPAPLRRGLTEYHARVRADAPAHVKAAAAKSKASLRQFLLAVFQRNPYGLTTSELRYLCNKTFSPFGPHEVHHGMLSGEINGLRTHGYLIQLPDPRRPGQVLRRRNIRGNFEDVYVLAPDRVADFEAYITRLLVKTDGDDQASAAGAHDR